MLDNCLGCSGGEGKSAGASEVRAHEATEQTQGLTRNDVPLESHGVGSIPKYQVCVEMAVPEEQILTAAAMAIQLNSLNKPSLGVARPLPGVSPLALRMYGATLTGRLWPRGRELHIQFMSGAGDPDVEVFKSKVKLYAAEWLKSLNGSNGYINIKLSFEPSSHPEIRIAFPKNRVFQSQVGTNSLLNPGQPSMSLGFVSANYSEEDYRMLILHEFGHALGMIHEHQQPSVQIPWNKPKVYADYKAWYGWSEEDVYNNVFFKYSLPERNHTDYDPKSIMLYSIPIEHVLDPGFAVSDNKDLSSKDREFMATQYPFP